ncbi:unnamed protein product [Pleuronectes platessa]|uniref:Uncharacterized protein n=1 Tax=Pleuronectes platessa TaxID=8262 RepID=A0A9N7U2P9_PLEPL|nr:unnamed protein product [Pleuronectes platessa]
MVQSTLDYVGTSRASKIKAKPSAVASRFQGEVTKWYDKAGTQTRCEMLSESASGNSLFSSLMERVRSSLLTVLLLRPIEEPFSNATREKWSSRRRKPQYLEIPTQIPGEDTTANRHKNIMAVRLQCRTAAPPCHHKEGMWKGTVEIEKSCLENERSGSDVDPTEKYHPALPLPTKMD